MGNSFLYFWIVLNLFWGAAYLQKIIIFINHSKTHVIYVINSSTSLRFHWKHIECLLIQQKICIKQTFQIKYPLKCITFFNQIITILLNIWEVSKRLWTVAIKLIRNSHFAHAHPYKPFKDSFWWDEFKLYIFWTYKL